MKVPSEHVGMLTHLHFENPVQNSKEPWREAQPNGAASCNTMTNLFGRQQDVANATLGQIHVKTILTIASILPIHQEPRGARTLPVQVSGYTVGLTNKIQCLPREVHHHNQTSFTSSPKV